MKLFCLCLLGIILVPALAGTDGFININCGASEAETGGDDMLWVSDSPFTNVSCRNTSTLSNCDIKLPSRSISYFTDMSQKKYCYLIPVKPGVHYLVRTRFEYGRFNSERLPLATVFDLFIQGIKWTTLNLPIDQITVPLIGKYIPFREIILAAQNDRLSLCLARNSQTEPHRYVFISTIVLRPLQSSMYATESADFDKDALFTINRKNFGGEDIDVINYRQNKSDEYTRTWYGYPPKGDMDLINTSYNLGTGLPNQVPQKVLQSAVVARKIEDMDISDAFVSLSPGSYSIIFYFCNINLTATKGGTTIFNVHINDQVTDLVDFKESLECKHIEHKLDIGRNGSRIIVVLRPFKYSASGPFINGAELYKILDVQNTYHQDVLAIWEIAEAINVPDDWSGGDPCLPSGYSSTGITCSKENPPRVIIINLTNMGLVGNIPPSIAKLTALTQLLLENNSLSGPLPDLSHMKNLTKL